MYINASAGHVVSQRHNITNVFCIGNDHDTTVTLQEEVFFFKSNYLLGSSQVQYVFLFCFVCFVSFKGWVIHKWLKTRCCRNKLLLVANRRRALCHLLSKIPQIVTVAKLWKTKLHKNCHLMQCERQFLKAWALLFIMSKEECREWRWEQRLAAFNARPLRSWGSEYRTHWRSKCFAEVKQ